MPDEALTNAFAELQSATDDMSRIDAQISRLQENKTKISERQERARQFIVSWHEFAGKPVPGEFVTIDHLMRPAVGSSSARNANPKKEAVAVAALELIHGREKPIPRPELHDLLKTRGLDVRGADPLVTLSTMLWRAGPRVGLTHLKGFGYWDGALPYPPAGYVPGDLVIDDMDEKTIAAINAPDEEGA